MYAYRSRFRRRAAEAAAETTSPTAGAATGAAATDDATGKKGGAAATSSTTPAQPAISFATEEEYKADIDAKLKERLDRERRKSDEKAAKARADAEAEALIKNQEWEKLAATRATLVTERDARIVELETSLAAANKSAERAVAAVKAQLEAGKKDLPAHILALLDKLDPVDQLTYLAANAEALGKPAAPTATLGATPRAADATAATSQQIKERQDAARRLHQQGF